MTDGDGEGLERVVHSTHIRASLDDVWAELTKRNEVQKPMFDMRMDCTLEVGSPLRMRSANGKWTGVVGEVLEYDPKRRFRFSFTFKFTSLDDPPCRVTYELEEKDGGVDFSMISDRLAPNTPSTKQMTRGGSMVAETLKSVCETGAVPFKTRMLYVLFFLMAPFTPAKCRSENWP